MNDLTVLRITAPTAQSDTLELLLEELGIDMSSWHEDGAPTCRFERFCETPDEAKRQQNRILERLRPLDPDGAISVQTELLEDRNWKESWKDFFHAERVSERIVIKPTWETVDTSPTDCVIEIDPGMSFGTGQHATTRACLVFLDRLSLECPDATFLDLGCGSGILSIAATKLGLSRITAFDVDPTAVEIANENAALNHASNAIHSGVRSVEVLDLDQPFDIVAANILAPILLQHAESIAAAVAPTPRARLILAGILTTQYDDVRKRYEDLGFVEVDRITDAEWTSGLFHRT